MNNLILTAFIIGFIPAALAQKGVDRNAGISLLQNFQCDNKGDATQRALDGLARSQAVIASIGDKEESCKGLSTRMSQLPDVSSITSKLRSSSAAQEIRRQEALINEALSDMSYVHSLPPEDPKRGLYPDEALLQQTIQSARVQLQIARSQMAVTGSMQESESRIQGVGQLDKITSEYIAALGSNDDCFKKQPQMREHLVSGLIGIAGFFMSGPLGIGTTIAGKALQHVFEAASTGNHRVRDDFSAADQGMVAIGIGCAFEQMGKQHCRIIREKQLFESANGLKGSKCDLNDPGLVSLKNILPVQKQMLEAVTKLQDWSNKTSIADPDPSASQLRESARSAFSQTISSIKQTVLSAQNTAKASAVFNGDAQKQALMGALGGFAQLLNSKASRYYDSNGGSQVVIPPGASMSLIRGGFTDQEQRCDFLNTLFQKDENPQDILNHLKDEYIAYRKAQAGQNGGNFESDPTLNSAFSIFQLMDGIPKEKVPPTVKMIQDRLQSRDAPKTILAKVEEFSNAVDKNLASDMAPEQVTMFLQEYFLGADVLDGSASPYESLKLLNTELKKMVAENPSYSKKTGLEQLSKEVSDIAVSSEKENNGVGITTVSQKQLIKDVNSLIGKNQQLYTRIKTVLNYQLAEKGREVTKGAASLPALFLLNQEVLDNTIGYSRNPSAKSADYETAIATSALQIDGMTKFSKDYQDFALQYFKGQDVKGRELSSGVRESISPNLLNRFCIQSLSMTEIPQEFRDACKGKKIVSGDVQVKYDDFVSPDGDANKDLPHSDRSCAYYNFTVQERAKSELKLGN